jgi:hypothetical protein
MNDDFISPEEMAIMTDVDPNTIYRILRADSKKPETERRIPGAVKEGSKYRGEWRIPRTVAENWKRDPRGSK